VAQPEFIFGEGHNQGRIQPQKTGGGRWYIISVNKPSKMKTPPTKKPVFFNKEGGRSPPPIGYATNDILKII